MMLNKLNALIFVLCLFPFLGFSVGNDFLPQEGQGDENYDPERISKFIISFESERGYSSLMQVEKDRDSGDFIPLDFDNPFMVEEFPTQTSLLQNYPNPFKPNTNISYTLEEDDEVRLEIYNALGSRVATLIDGQQQAGRYNILFDGSTLNSGIYMYRLETPSQTFTRRMSLL